jgi:ATP-dependent exoDNAse (exonuclease V) beta subunit
MHKLSIYKASAGSGKTFKITGEYLKLIFNDSNTFSEILAVTFTNKATGEMRERILKELHILASGQTSDYANDLKNTFKLSNTELQKKAKKLLNNILHNYSRFNINTIDSFFQKILRAFTYETGLSSGFNIELNFKQILALSVENFFANSEKTSKWLSNFAIQKIENGKHWDIEKDILEFSSGAFNEVFFNLTEKELKELNNIDNFILYKKELKEHIDYFVEKLRDLGQKTVDTLNKNNLTISDFTYGKTSVANSMCKLKDINYNNIKKFGGARIDKALNTDDGITGWCKKGYSKQDEIQTCVNTELLGILKNIYALFDNYFVTFNTALIIWKSIDLFAILVEIFNELNTYCKEKNIFLLSLASPLLAKMIGESDAPFIYEKTGEYLKFFMIDEFQDTSKLQWNNFEPLFYNSISQGYNNMVVGDVKQSIYRWRNGDWTLLNNVLTDSFMNFGVKEISLEYNWRSVADIIKFNNNLFEKISAHAILYLTENVGSDDDIKKFEQTIHSIYSSAYQEIPEKNKNTTGMVHVEFFDKKKNKDDEKPDSQWYLDKMIDALNELFDKNYQPRDIAILVRTGKNGAMVAKHIMEYTQQHPERQQQFTFVSNDSVLLGSSSIILLLIAILEYLADSDNNQSKATVIYFYSLLNHTPIESAKSILMTNFKDDTEFLNIMPLEFSKSIDSLKKMPLSHLVNRLLSIFIYSNNSIDISKQLPFIHTFQDSILTYTTSNNNDIQGFLNWWKEYGINQPVNLSDEQNAIRIITIHKSKGLEYDAVIIPFADWDLDQKDKYMWCKTSSNFNKLPIVPVKYSKNMVDSEFKREYVEEKTMALIDNINLLYVSVTRAVKALYMFAPIPTKEGEAKLISDFIFNIFSTSKEFSETWDIENCLFKTGKLKKIDTIQTKNNSSNDKFTLPSVLKEENRLKLRLSAQNYFIDDDDNLAKKINKGSVYHKIMENIVSFSDIDIAVKNTVAEGLLPAEEETELTKKIKKYLSDNKVKSWFDGTYKVINENSIIVDNKTIKRPDRVMIGKDEIIVVDYKFTSQQQDKHIKQVKEYMSYIESIENKKTIGYVWYIFSDVLTAINPS